MKRTLVALALAAVTLLPLSARADDACAPGVQCLKTVVIHGRAEKPLVVVELRHASAARAAGQAHAEMHARWIRQLVPVTLER